MGNWTSMSSTNSVSPSAALTKAQSSGATLPQAHLLTQISPIAQTFLGNLLNWQLLTPDMIEPFLESRADRLGEYVGEVELGKALVEEGYLTRYQLDRALSGRIHGLILGNYRVLDQVGKGGMGSVYRAEHRLMKRRVAIKVLPVDDDVHPSLLHRFYGEMKVLAELNHPNIVTAFDAGEVVGQGPNMPSLLYMVMELVNAGDLEHVVAERGPAPISQACDWIRQAAEGLQAAHNAHVVHRDIKPSNLLLSTRGEVKLVDFGLARQFCSQLTDPRALLGSVEFMAPEQSHDPSSVGPAADIYGLGATLFWLLTGEAPYRLTRNVGTALRALQREQPRKLRDLLPSAPIELESLISRMLERDPASRPQTPIRSGSELEAFVEAPPASLTEFILDEVPEAGEESVVSPSDQETRAPRVVVVDPNPTMGLLFEQALLDLQTECHTFEDLKPAWEIIRSSPVDLLLLDRGLIKGKEVELVRKIREIASRDSIKIILMVNQKERAIKEPPEEIDDLLIKPCELRDLRLKVNLTLRLQQAEEKVHAYKAQAQSARRELELSMDDRGTKVRQAHDALLFAMARMAESRDGETAGHLRRLQRYVEVLARYAALSAPWKGLIDANYLEQLRRCVPLHDIGKIGLPHEILRKPGQLSPEERALVQTHPLIGDRILESLAEEHGNSLDFLGMARTIVRHHHEQYDGLGYPDGLKGNEIPPPARLLHLADVYDALRRTRSHKTAMSHEATTEMLLGSLSSQFDPSLLDAFEQCQKDFALIFREIGDRADD